MKKSLLCIALCLTGILQANAEIAIIVHPDNASTFNDDEIKRLFLGKSKSFPSGEKATPLTLADNTVTDDFNKKVLNKSSSQVKAYWSKLVFTGKGMPPKELSSSDLISEVSANPEMIGYIDAAQVSDKVKVVASF